MSIYKKVENVQKEIGKLSKNKTNPFYKSRYFDINTLLEQLKPLLEKEGLILSQPLSNVDGRPALKTVLTDGEETIEDTVTMPDIQDPQKVGSSITYYRRYALVSLLLIKKMISTKSIKIGYNETRKVHNFNTCTYCRRL